MFCSWEGKKQMQLNNNTNDNSNSNSNSNSRWNMSGVNTTKCGPKAFFYLVKPLTLQLAFWLDLFLLVIILILFLRLACCCEDFYDYSAFAKAGLWVVVCVVSLCSSSVSIPANTQLNYLPASSVPTTEHRTLLGNL